MVTQIFVILENCLTNQLTLFDEQVNQRCLLFMKQLKQYPHMKV